MQDRQDTIRFIEQNYFGSVSRGDLAQIMACFAPEARVLIRHGDQLERQFGVKPSVGETPLIDFYRHLCGNYDAWFGEFSHTIDTVEQRAASRFTVQLTPKPDGLYADADKQRLLNCNFFEFKDGVISWMLIYYANPPADPDSANTGPKPTGYPQP